MSPSDRPLGSLQPSRKIYVTRLFGHNSHALKHCACPKTDCQEGRHTLTGEATVLQFAHNLTVLDWGESQNSNVIRVNDVRSNFPLVFVNCIQS